MRVPSLLSPRAPRSIAVRSKILKACAVERPLRRRDPQGFHHDFSKFAENCEMDKRAIEALGVALEGSERPLLVTSGLATVAQGRMATEEDAPLPPSATYPRASEVTGEKLLKRGVRVGGAPSQVHNTVKQGLVTYAVALALEKGLSAYVGDGLNRWAAVHVLDAARLYRLRSRRDPRGRYHAIAEEVYRYERSRRQSAEA